MNEVIFIPVNSLISSTQCIPYVIAEKDIYQTIKPAHLGPESMGISIHPTHIAWRDKESKTFVSDFQKSKHILRTLISNQDKIDFSLKWIPAQSNVHFLLELLRLLHENNGRYSFEIDFSHV